MRLPQRPALSPSSGPEILGGHGTSAASSRAQPHRHELHVDLLRTKLNCRGMIGGSIKSVLGWIAIALVFAATGGAAADPAPLLGNEVTLSTQPGNKIVRFYPEIAQRAGVEGSASALCRIAASGDLSDCAILSEDPQGCRFGEAAVRLASSLRARPRAKNGSETSGRTFRFDLRFKLPANQATGATRC